MLKFTSILQQLVAMQTLGLLCVVSWLVWQKNDQLYDTQKDKNAPLNVPTC